MIMISLFLKPTTLSLNFSNSIFQTFTHALPCMSKRLHGSGAYFTHLYIARILESFGQFWQLTMNKLEFIYYVMPYFRYVSHREFLILCSFFLFAILFFFVNNIKTEFFYTVYNYRHRKEKEHWCNIQTEIRTKNVFYLIVLLEFRPCLNSFKIYFYLVCWFCCLHL